MKFDYTAFFDLDRTITKTVSGKIIAITAYRKGLVKKNDLVNAFFNSLAFTLRIRNHRKIIDDMIGWVKGIDEKEIIDLCYEVFTTSILPSVFKEVKTEIEFHKKKNARLVILSSSIEPLCKLVKNHLNMDDIICTKLEVRDGKYTGKATGKPCFGTEKLTRMQEYCAKNNINPDKVWYYGDSKADIPVLSSVGHPVCINPERYLRNKARKNNWTIYYWNHVQ